MIRGPAFLLLLLLGLMAGGARAQGLEPRGALLAAIRSSDCDLDATERETAFERAQVKPDAAEALLRDFEAEGVLLEAGDGVLALAPAYCGLSRAPAREVLVAALRFHGCAMAEADAEALLGPFGLTMDSTGPTAEALLEAGEAVLDDGGILRLSATICTGPNAAAGPVDAEREAFLHALRDHDCRMSDSLAREVLPEYGLDPSRAEALIGEMVAAGEGRLVGGGFVLGAALCAGSAPPGDLVDLFRAAGCTVARSDLPDLAAVAGIDPGRLDADIAAMVEAGDIAAAGPDLTLAAGLCAPQPEEDESEAKPLVGPQSAPAALLLFQVLPDPTFAGLVIAYAEDHECLIDYGDEDALFDALIAASGPRLGFAPEVLADAAVIAEFRRRLEGGLGWIFDRLDVDPDSRIARLRDCG